MALNVCDDKCGARKFCHVHPSWRLRDGSPFAVNVTTEKGALVFGGIGDADATGIITIRRDMGLGDHTVFIPIGEARKLV